MPNIDSPMHLNFILGGTSNVNPSPPAAAAANTSSSVTHSTSSWPYSLDRFNSAQSTSPRSAVTPAPGPGTGAQPSALPVHHVEGAGSAPGAATATSHFISILPGPGTGVAVSPFTGTGTESPATSTALHTTATPYRSTAGSLLQLQQSSSGAQASTSQASAGPGNSQQNNAQLLAKLKNYYASVGSDRANTFNLALNDYKKAIRKVVIGFPIFAEKLGQSISEDAFDTAKSANTELLLVSHAHIAIPEDTAKRRAVDNFIMQHRAVTTAPLPAIEQFDHDNHLTLLAYAQMLRSQTDGIDAICVTTEEKTARKTKRLSLYDKTHTVRKFARAFLHIRMLIAPTVGTDIAREWSGNATAIAALKSYEPAFLYSAGRGRTAVSQFITDLESGSVTAAPPNQRSNVLQPWSSRPAS